MEKFCYQGDMISCYGGALETVSARIDTAWKRFRGLSGVLVEKQGLSLKQWGKIYQCCVRSILLYSFNPFLVFGENIGCRCSNECNSSYC